MCGVCNGGVGGGYVAWFGQAAELVHAKSGAGLLREGHPSLPQQPPFEASPHELRCSLLTRSCGGCCAVAHTGEILSLREPAQREPGAEAVPERMLRLCERFRHS